MIRPLLVLAIILPLVAQTPAAQAPAPGAPATPPTPAAPPAPVPATEPWFTGSVDVGYRWLTGVGGSLDTYRSIVDLGSGPKLLGVDLTLRDAKHRLFDRIDIRAFNWGDDPYSTLHVDVRKAKLYDF